MLSKNSLRTHARPSQNERHAVAWSGAGTNKVNVGEGGVAVWRTEHHQLRHRVSQSKGRAFEKAVALRAREGGV